MRKLKTLLTGFEITKYDILLCCQIFFWDVNRTIRSTIPEYQEQQFAYENGIDGTSRWQTGSRGLAQ